MKWLTVGGGLPWPGALAFAASACMLWGCSPAVPAQGASAPASSANGGDKGPDVETMMARENEPSPKHPIELFDGLSTGEIEGKTAPRPECKKDDDGFRTCTLDVDLGKAPDGSPSNIGCAFSTRLRSFGPMVKELLQESGLNEMPVIEVKPLGEGIAAYFAANFSREHEGGVHVGTMKIASLYAHGYVLSCYDAQPGGRKTFPRVIEAFFQSLKFKELPEQPAVFAQGYRERTGDRTTGFKFRLINRESAGEQRFFELSTFFSLTTDGKTWSVADAGIETIRDKAGAIESTRELYWMDGKGPAVLSAKPSEGGKFRLKFEVGDKTDALEATPQVPLTSELWSAPDLAKLSSGALPKYRYATLDLDDGDPVFRYVTLTRVKAGTLLEDPEPLKKSKSTPSSDAQHKNNLEVDAKGVVTKQVGATATTELVHTWGALPTLGRGASAKGKNAP